MTLSCTASTASWLQKCHNCSNWQVSAVWQLMGCAVHDKLLRDQSLHDCYAQGSLTAVSLASAQLVVHHDENSYQQFPYTCQYLQSCSCDWSPQLGHGISALLSALTARHASTRLTSLPSCPDKPMLSWHTLSLSAHNHTRPPAGMPLAGASGCL